MGGQRVGLAGDLCRRRHLALPPGHRPGLRPGQLLGGASRVQAGMLRIGRLVTLPDRMHDVQT